MEEKKTLWDYFDKNIPIIAELEGEFNKNHKRLKKLIEAKSEPKKIIGVITQQKELIGRYFQQFKFLKEICKKLGYDSFIINKLNLVSLSRLVEIAELIQANARKGNLDELYGYYKAEEDAINRFNAENTEFRGIKTDFKPGFFSGVRRWAGVMIAVITLISATSILAQQDTTVVKQDTVSVSIEKGGFRNRPSSVSETPDVKEIEDGLKRSKKYREINKWEIKDKKRIKHTVEFNQGWYHGGTFVYKIDGKIHVMNIPKSRVILIKDIDGKGLWTVTILKQSNIFGWVSLLGGGIILVEKNGEFYLVYSGDFVPMEEWWK